MESDINASQSYLRILELIVVSRLFYADYVMIGFYVNKSIEKSYLVWGEKLIGWTR